jgi:hypothetical protein
MALAVADFLKVFPEFNALYAEDPTYVSAALARAERRVSDSWGDRRDDVVGYTAAHQLALSPYGRNARMIDGKNVSTYSVELEKMKKGHACARMRSVTEAES